MMDWDDGTKSKIGLDVGMHGEDGGGGEEVTLTAGNSVSPSVIP
jgi:hypothetical protein